MFVRQEEKARKGVPPATIASGSSTNEFQYTGRENDGTGVFFNRGRYYDPVFQRFVSEDPIGSKGGTNLFAYVGDSPTNATDPTGLYPSDATLCQLFGAVYNFGQIALLPLGSSSAGLAIMTAFASNPAITGCSLQLQSVTCQVTTLSVGSVSLALGGTVVAKAVLGNEFGGYGLAAAADVAAASRTTVVLLSSANYVACSNIL